MVILFITLRSESSTIIGFIKNYLWGRIDPYFWLAHFIPVRKEEEVETVHGPGESEAADDEGEQEDDGDCCREVDNLAGGSHALP